MEEESVDLTLIVLMFSACIAMQGYLVYASNRNSKVESVYMLLSMPCHMYHYQ